MTRLILLFAAIAALVAGPAAAAPRLDGVTPGVADALVAKLTAAQAGLRRGDKLYIGLLSGAPAAYDATLTPPREAFLKLTLDQPFSIAKRPADNPSWNAYRLEYLPDGPGHAVWDVEVVLGFYGQIERVEMFQRPPHPF